MGDNKTFRVNVQTSTSKKINVTSNVSENFITASPDTGLYYSRLSEKWAIGEGLVENKDYSSKTYATQAKEYANESKMYSESANLDLRALENKITEYDTQLGETITEGLANITTAESNAVSNIEASIGGIDAKVQAGKTDIDNAKTQAINTIETKKNDSLDTLETKTQESIERIENTSGGGSANAVTLDTDQTITGKKTYTQELRYRPDNGYQNILLGQSGQGAYGLVFESNNSAYEFVLQNQGYSASSLKVAGFNGGVKFGNTVNFNSSIYDKEGKEITGGGGSGDYVAKTGDTMTGTLNLTGMSDGECQQRIVSGNYGLMFRQDDNCFYMLPTNSGDAYGHWNDLRPFVLNLAEGYITTSTPTAGDNSSKLATTNFVKSVLSSSGTGLATISKASNGSCAFNNGLIINWGRTSVNASTTATATFKTPFTSTNYKVVLGLYLNNADSQKNYTTYTYTTTNFVIYNGQANKVNYDWIAIGY